MGIYIEKDEVGQCTFFDFDLVGTGYCTSSWLSMEGEVGSGWQDGRVALFGMLLEDVYGLPPAQAGVDEGPDLPEPETFAWELRQSSPNPFKGTAKITYGVAAPADVRISVYGPAGALVRTLVDRRQAPGHYSTAWDGTNNEGRRVADGVYFCKMTTVEFTATRKMLLMR